MSYEKEKKIFANRLNYYMRISGKTQADLICDLGINKSTISTWCNAIKMPRMGTIQTLADYFGVNKSDLIEEHIISEDITPADVIYYKGKKLDIGSLSEQDKDSIAKYIEFIINNSKNGDKNS